MCLCFTANQHHVHIATSFSIVDTKATPNALRPRQPSTKGHMTHTNHLGLQFNVRQKNPPPSTSPSPVKTSTPNPPKWRTTRERSSICTCHGFYTRSSSPKLPCALCLHLRIQSAIPPRSQAKEIDPVQLKIERMSNLPSAAGLRLLRDIS